MCPKSSKPLLLFVWILIGFSLILKTECILKLLVKKKFIEGFLVGVLVGKEYYEKKNPNTPYYPPQTQQHSPQQQAYTQPIAAKVADPPKAPEVHKPIVPVVIHESPCSHKSHSVDHFPETKTPIYHHFDHNHDHHDHGHDYKPPIKEVHHHIDHHNDNHYNNHQNHDIHDNHIDPYPISKGFPSNPFKRSLKNYKFPIFVKDQFDEQFP